MSEPSGTPDDPLAAVEARLAASEREREELSDALREAGLRERQLAYELEHRVRNILAVLRSIYRRTRERGASHDEFAEHFEGRLGAIARYQAEIVGVRSDGIELEDMVRDELLEVHCFEGPDCTIAGPPVRLRQKWAELIGLALHELTTNAIKFGALYHGGKLRVEWSIDESSAPATVSLGWHETGLPLLAATPRPRGFGQDLIEDALPYELGAKTAFEFQPGGFDCAIEFPLPPSAGVSRADADMTDDATPFFQSETE